MSRQPLKDYALGFGTKPRANPATPETGLAPNLQQLVEQILPSIPAIEPLTVSPEFNKTGVGQPGIAPDPERVRRRLYEVLGRARGSSPNMAKWLADEEADQLRVEFAQELERPGRAA